MFILENNITYNIAIVNIVGDRYETSQSLLMYISDKEHFKENIEVVTEKLKAAIPAMNRLFKNFDFNVLLKELKEYSDRVELDYKD